MVLSIGLGAPAGYALSRFDFPGKEAFRFLVVMTRAFPLPLLALPLAVMFIRTGLDDTIARAGAGAHHAGAALRGADHLLALLRHPGRARGGRLDARLHPGRRPSARWCCRSRLPGIAASAVFAFVISWNEVFAAAVLTIENRTLTAFLLQSLERLAAAAEVRRRRGAGAAGADLHLRRPQIPLRDVGHRQPLGDRPWPRSASRTSPSASAPSPRCTRSTSPSATASSWCCSAPRAAARPRSCASSPGSRPRPGARSGSASAGSTGLPPRERGIAMVFQNYAVFPHLTVFENIAFGLRMAQVPQAEVERRVDRTAELMHIEQLLGALLRPALRRPAPARRRRPRAGHGARRDPDGRAALQPRRAAAPGDARRAQGRAGRSRGPPRSTSPTTRSRRCRSPTASR